jgi:hypothetical protein
MYDPHKVEMSWEEENTHRHPELVHSLSTFNAFFLKEVHEANT